VLDLLRAFIASRSAEAVGLELVPTSLADRWQRFAETVIGPFASDDEVRTMRACFYAGAQTTVHLIDAAGAAGAFELESFGAHLVEEAEAYESRSSEPPRSVMAAAMPPLLMLWPGLMIRENPLLPEERCAIARFLPQPRPQGCGGSMRQRHYAVALAGQSSFFARTGVAVACRTQWSVVCPGAGNDPPTLLLGLGARR
jgi:hypothetical protein